jgi:hypothetical protein
MKRARANKRGRPLMLGEGRETSLTRLSAQTDQRRTLIVATNGECTEIAYLSKIKLEPWVQTGKVTVVLIRGDPAEVVRNVARRRDENDYDEAWAVCDVDQYPTGEASRLGEELRVQIAWSNPCFELWLLLHFQRCNAYLEDCKKARNRLRRCLPNWDKSDLKFSEFQSRVGDAVEKAKALGDPPDVNPSTGVWRLIEAFK